MSKSVATAVFILFSFLVAQHAVAELPGNFQKIKGRYWEERTRGLINLNEKYIALYKKELAAATRAKQLDDVTVILSEIEALTDEISELKSGAGKNKSPKRFSLKGKMARWGSNIPPHNPIEIEFEAGGKAVFTGLNKKRIDWQYKEGADPTVFYLWGPRQELEQGWKLELDANGKSGKITKKNVGFSTDAVLFDTP